MSYCRFGEENECWGCVDFDQEGMCYFTDEACKICLRNPFVLFDEVRNIVFINKAFLIQPPEDMYLAEVNPDTKSIGFVARFGLPPQKIIKLSLN